MVPVLTMSTCTGLSRGLVYVPCCSSVIVTVPRPHGSGSCDCAGVGAGALEGPTEAPGGGTPGVAVGSGMHASTTSTLVVESAAISSGTAGKPRVWTNATRSLWPRNSRVGVHLYSKWVCADALIGIVAICCSALSFQREMIKPSTFGPIRK